ncbi:MAG: ribosomal RNA small subunit methyltransferase A [Candidatus Omnitrophica bacterium]|nr:ribosomal RNA small subunit methyltransferase A [Candidatus Omnitrophota bacterium]
MHQIQLLKKYELSIRGFRGQHLLVDENIQRKFVSLVNPTKGEVIVEIGPGLGAITELLLQSGAKVIAIEQDERFIEILKGELEGDYKNLTLVHADILKVNLKKYIPAKSHLKIVGNIPYYITSAILLYLIGHRTFIDSAYLTVQREIADRIFAQPGTKAYGRLSLLVRFYADIHRAFEISRNCFSPKPKVDSAALELTFRQTLPASVDEILLFDLIKFGFGERRKNILNAISDGFRGQITKQEAKVLLNEAGLQENMRAEELMLKDFICLAELFGKRFKPLLHHVALGN